ncbi:MAG: hypothetical protein NW224_06230 [Leptolyngbyaceae cyanobacterium bins.302]|nr:hypothetical protein [Leptolyngbyaceae cyanobacterium bins.302]
MMLANLQTASKVVSEQREMLLPSVLDERLVCLFTYWDQEIVQGMRYGNELYTLFRAYSSQERLQAYQAASEQVETGLAVCITVSKKSYCVWLNLRSLSTLSS